MLWQLDCFLSVMGKEAAPPWGECRGRQYMAVGRRSRRRCCRRGGNPPSPDGLVFVYSFPSTFCAIRLLHRRRLYLYACILLISH